MYLGTQFPARNDDDYRVYAQLGVHHICGWPEAPATEWSVDYLSAYRERIESFGITLDMVPLPGSVATGKPGAPPRSPNIMLGKSPERDREIEHACEIIRMCAQVGIPSVKYNLNILPVLRTERTRGRGGASNSTFRWEDADHDAPTTEAGEVSAEEMWERIDYFLERVVPVAEAHKIRMGCHPHDPYVPPGYMGVTRVLATVDGLKKFVQMHESPYHGLNFCQGTVSEMLEKPGEEIYDVIRWFGERKKIFNVHFRNIRGGRLNFVETFPDEGDVDMLRAARVYREVGYPYMLMADHVPWVSGENHLGVGFAFAYGYIQALIQAVNDEG